MGFRRPMPQIVRRIREHGGIADLLMVPLVSLRSTDGRPADDGERWLKGWHNVVVCGDGTRIGLTPEEESQVEHWPCIPD
jgi:hypothetical protein